MDGRDAVIQQRREPAGDTTVQEVELRLFAAGGRKGGDDPMVQQLLLAEDAKPMSDEEMYEMMDRALGEKTVVDALNEIR